MSSKSIIAVFSLALLAASMTGCGGGCGGSGVAQKIPKGSYFIMMGVNMKELLASKAFEEMTELVENAEGYFAGLEGMFRDSEIDIREANCLMVAMSSDMTEHVMFLRGPRFNAPFLKDFFEDEQDMDFDEQSEDGVTYWADEDQALGVVEAEGGVFVGNGRTIEDIAEVMAGKGRNLASDEDARRALSLVDSTATLYAVIWDKLDTDQPGTGDIVRSIREGDEAEEVLEVIHDLEAAGVSMILGDGLQIHVRILCEDAEAATILKGFLDEMLEKVSERIAYNVRNIFRNIFKNFDERAMMDFVEHISVSQSGDVIEFRIAYDDIGELIDAARAGLEVRRRLDKSMANIRLLDMAIMEYRVNHYFLPQTESIAELAELLDEYLRDEDVLKDGWGNDLVYQLDPGDRYGYTIISYGADGEPGPDIPEGERDPAFINFEEDLVWSNGRWVRRPPELEFRY